MHTLPIEKIQNRSRENPQTLLSIQIMLMLLLPAGIKNFGRGYSKMKDNKIQGKKAKKMDNHKIFFTCHILSINWFSCICNATTGHEELLLQERTQAQKCAQGKRGLTVHGVVVLCVRGRSRQALLPPHRMQRMQRRKSEKQLVGSFHKLRWFFGGRGE